MDPQSLLCCRCLDIELLTTSVTVAIFDSTPCTIDHVLVALAYGGPLLQCKCDSPSLAAAQLVSKWLPSDNPLTCISLQRRPLSMLYITKELPPRTSTPTMAECTPKQNHPYTRPTHTCTLAKPLAQPLGLPVHKRHAHSLVVLVLAPHS